MTGVIVLLVIAVAIGVTAGSAGAERRRSTSRSAPGSRPARWAALLGRAGSAVPFHRSGWNQGAPEIPTEDQPRR